MQISATREQQSALVVLECEERDFKNVIFNQESEDLLQDKGILIGGGVSES